MNWKRIGTGMLCAAAVLMAFKLGALWYLEKSGDIQLTGEWGKVVLLQILPPALMTGFLLCWLYVLARPRLGPGPKTALLMGTVSFALVNEQILDIVYWQQSPVTAATQIVFSWLKYIVAIYLAGWQYMEKAP